MKERILWVGGDQRRHLHYVNGLKDLNIVGGIVQERDNAIPSFKAQFGTDGVIDRVNWDTHFRQRNEAEEKYFGNPKLPELPLLKVDKETLNDIDSCDFVKKIKPDMAIVFGTRMIREPLLSCLPKKTINLHLGLSPRYRGAATLFWPFYMLEPNWAGTTFHYIVDTPDGGDIIHQVVPQLEMGDGIHDVAFKAVLQSTKEALVLFQMDKWKRFKQKPEAGKNFLESDFQPKHLRVIYTYFGNKIVDAYLNGDIKPKEPNLKRQF